MTRTITPAVLYICAARSQDTPGLAVQRAEQEGRDFADHRGLHIGVEITDPFGEPDPQKRSGWMRVREMAERGEVEVVITRWPNALSPVSEWRYPELDHLGRHGAQLLFSWAPLGAMVGGGSTR
ncbi:hypothetical protein ACIQNI_07285 [Streptomyces sp. NPDC091266]|uniref:hypothetical protein n=1 Tax=Streptomyces sp. NPDC091266 TaxID=3365978 RepID=UPI003827329B